MKHRINVNISQFKVETNKKMEIKKENLVLISK